MSIQKTFLHYMLCIRTVPFQTVEILFGLVNMSIDYITLKLKKITLYLSLICTKEIFNGKVRVRSKVSSSIWDQKWARQYLLAPEPGPTWVISSWWLSVNDPMTSAFLLSLLNAKRINIDIKIESDWHERNKYGILWNIRHSSYNSYHYIH